MLARDIADLNPDLLERAILDHARSSVFMPKAAELIAAVREMEPKGEPDLLALVKKYNERLRSEGRFDIEWTSSHGNMQLDRMTHLHPASDREITATLEQINAYAKEVEKARRIKAKRQET